MGSRLTLRLLLFAAWLLFMWALPARPQSLGVGGFRVGNDTLTLTGGLAMVNGQALLVSGMSITNFPDSTNYVTSSAINGATNVLGFSVASNTVVLGNVIIGATAVSNSVNNLSASMLNVTGMTNLFLTPGATNNAAAITNLLCNSLGAYVWANNGTATNLGVLTSFGLYCGITAQGLSQSGGDSAPSYVVLGMYKQHTNSTYPFPTIRTPGTNWYTLGRDNVYLCRNTDASSLTNGDLVYLVQSSACSNGILDVARAQANSSATMPVFGRVSFVCVTNGVQCATNGGLVRIMTSGESMQTEDCAQWSTGAVLYASATYAGRSTNVPPVYPNIIQQVGSCAIGSNQQGRVLINIQPIQGSLLFCGTNYPSTNGLVTVPSSAVPSGGGLVYSTINTAAGNVTNTLPSPSTVLYIYNKTNSANSLLVTYGTTTQTVNGTTLVKCYPDQTGTGWAVEY